MSFFLGLDSSTQGLKALVLEQSGKIVLEKGLNYDQALPHYKTSHGVYKSAGNVVTTPTLMLAEALDLLFEGIEKESPGLLSRVQAISGSGQQHGSVYWKKGARLALQSFDGTVPFKSLPVSEWFSYPEAPIWMDSSTRAQCDALEHAVGGPSSLASVTGSKAYERFTGLQIMKKATKDPATFASTERVSLISSFMCSLLLGDYAPIDESDGSGMNLLDLKTMKWDEAIMKAVSPSVPLAPLLGDVVQSHTVVGRISPYFQRRYGFTPACRVAAWSGDNPNSLVGLRLSSPGDVGISLGTSDTVFCILDAKDASPGLEGHVFRSPVDGAHRSMSMLCYKNGSVTREKIVTKAGTSWSTFAQTIQETPAGNNGHVGFYFLEPEIIPLVLNASVVRFGPQDQVLTAFPPQVEVRAVVESQILSMRVHAQRLGMKPVQIIITGGASVNPQIAQIIADVFGVEVRRSVQSNSAALGAALRALHAVQCEKAGTYVPFEECTPKETHELAATPNAKHHAVYNSLLPRYERLEEQALSLLASSSANQFTVS